MKHPKCSIDSSAFGEASSPALANSEILTEGISVCTEERFVIHVIPCGTLVSRNL